jgi:hypothetical protein
MKREVRKTHATVLPPEYYHLDPVNATKIEKIFQKYHLWTGKRTPTVKLPNRCRHEANYNSLIWHSNLHHFHHGDWIIAWIDGRSRLCLGFNFLLHMTFVETSKALEEGLKECHVPYSIWTDNGKEFAGSFQNLLREPGIGHIYSAPTIRSKAGNVKDSGALLKCRPVQTMSPV